MALLKRQYEVTSDFSAFNFETKVQRDFVAGETFYGTAADGAITTKGFSIPDEYVKDLGLKNSILMLAGIGIAFLIIAFIVYKKVTKK